MNYWFVMRYSSVYQHLNRGFTGRYSWWSTRNRKYIKTKYNLWFKCRVQIFNLVNFDFVYIYSSIFMNTEQIPVGTQLIQFIWVPSCLMIERHSWIFFDYNFLQKIFPSRRHKIIFFWCKKQFSLGVETKSQRIRCAWAHIL